MWIIGVGISGLLNHFLVFAIFAGRINFQLMLHIMYAGLGVVSLIAAVSSLWNYLKSSLIDYLWLSMAMVGLGINLAIIGYFNLVPGIWEVKNADRIFWVIIFLGISTSNFGFILLSVAVNSNNFGEDLSKRISQAALIVWILLVSLSFILRVDDYGVNLDLVWNLHTLYKLFAAIILTYSWYQVDLAAKSDGFVFMKQALLAMGIHSIIYTINDMYKEYSRIFFGLNVWQSQIFIEWNIFITVTLTVLGSILILVIVFKFPNITLISLPQIQRSLIQVNKYLSSRNFSDLAKGETLLRRVKRITGLVDEKDVDLQYRYQNLQLLMLQYSFDKQKSTREDLYIALEEYLTDIESSSQPMERVNALIIRSKFASLDGDLVKSRSLLLEAKEISTELGLNNLSELVDDQLAELENAYLRWEHLIEKNNAFGEQVRSEYLDLFINLVSNQNTRKKVPIS